jgi:hypothetical protein
MPPTVRQDPPSTVDFVNRFQASVLNSAIGVNQYVDWDYIDAHVENAKSFEQQENLAAFASSTGTTEDFLSRLQSLDGLERADFVDSLAQLLLEVTPARDAVSIALSVVGDTNDTFVVRDYAKDVQEIASGLESGDRDEAEEFATVLTDLGLRHLVNQGHQLESILAGVRLGLESHRRKNRQGELYMETIQSGLDKVTAELESAGVTASCDDEVTVDLGEENKTLDYLLYIDGEPRIGFELNCYKARGSKPSEIKRAYQKLADRMDDHGLALVWVTDGYAWKGPLESVLTEAYESHKDMYKHRYVGRPSVMPSRWPSTRQSDSVSPHRNWLPSSSPTHSHSSASSHSGGTSSRWSSSTGSNSASSLCGQSSERCSPAAPRSSTATR